MRDIAREVEGDARVGTIFVNRGDTRTEVCCSDWDLASALLRAAYGAESVSA